MEKFNSSALTTMEEKRNPVNIESLNGLAKLLATEDLNIIHNSSAHTASFSPETRTLVLPAWKDLSKVVYLLFTGHEVGHALFTPVGGRSHPKIPKAYTKRSGFQSIINVVEDARIEKKMKRKYPGLRADFTEGYRRLLGAGFFGRITLDDINASNLIDRLNMAYKCSSNLSGVHFEEGEEKDFFDRGYLLETFEDTVDMAVDLYEYMKDNMPEDEDEDGRDTNPGDTGEGEEGEGEPGESHEYEEVEDDGEEGEEAEGNGSGNGDSDDDGDEESDAGSDGDDDEDDASDGDDSSNDDSGKEEGEEDGSGDISEGVDAGGSSDDDEYDPGSETDEATRSNTNDLVDSNAGETITATIPFDRVDHHSVIHDTKRILQDFDKVITEGAKNVSYNDRAERAEWTAGFNTNLHVECMKYVNKCKSVVSYLVKEFEMKKAADEHRRSSTARSGVINVGALHSYKYNEDIFLKKAVVADAKNHGLVMFVDFSGSMSGNMEGTIEQLINLVLFCKKVSIPFEVYGFGNSGVSYNSRQDGFPGIKDGDLVPAPFVLRKYISNGLSSREYNRALDYLIFLKVHYGRYNYGYYNAPTLNDVEYHVGVPNHDQLGSTPLDEAIIMAANIVDDFRNANSVQICNVVFLTDGESNPISECWSAKDGSCVSLRYGMEDVIIRDEKTKKSYSFRNHRSSRYGFGGATGFLLSSLSERCGVKVAGFRILAGSTQAAKKDLRSFIINAGVETPNTYEGFSGYIDEIFSVMKKDGSACVDIPGYDELFVVRGDSNLKTSEDGILDDVADDAKVADIRKAFKKNSKGKLKTRVMLTKFIDMIA